MEMKGFALDGRWVMRDRTKDDKPVIAQGGPEDKQVDPRPVSPPKPAAV